MARYNCCVIDCYFAVILLYVVVVCTLRALKTKGNTPKYGLIFHSTYIGRAGSKNKGRVSRYLANKCSIASRIDCFSGELMSIRSMFWGERVLVVGFVSKLRGDSISGWGVRGFPTPEADLNF